MKELKEGWIFLSGSRSILTGLPETALVKLRELGRGNRMLLVGPDPGAAASIRDYLRFCRIGFGSWDKAGQGEADVWEDLEKRRARDARMIRSCDEGVFLWDGSSKGTFLNIVDLLLQEKPVEVLIFRGKAVSFVRLRSLEDLDRILPPELTERAYPYDPIPDEAWTRLADIMTAAEGEYLIDELSDLYKPGVINRLRWEASASFMTLNRKLALFRALASYEDLFRDFLERLEEDWLEMERPDPEDWVRERLIWETWQAVDCNSYTRQAEDLEKDLRELDLRPGEFFFVKRRGLRRDPRRSLGWFRSLEAAKDAVRLIWQDLWRQEDVKGSGSADCGDGLGSSGGLRGMSGTGGMCGMGGSKGADRGGDADDEEAVYLEKWVPWRAEMIMTYRYTLRNGEITEAVNFSDCQNM